MNFMYTYTDLNRFIYLDTLFSVLNMFISSNTCYGFLFMKEIFIILCW